MNVRLIAVNGCWRPLTAVTCTLRLITSRLNAFETQNSVYNNGTSCGRAVVVLFPICLSAMNKNFVFRIE